MTNSSRIKRMQAICIAAVFTLIAVPTVTAANMSFSTVHCQVDMNYDVAVNPQQVTFSDKGKTLYQISADTLLINGESIKLTDEQRHTLEQYQDAITAQVPKVVTFIGDVSQFASTAVTESLQPLLSDSANRQLDKLVEQVNSKIEQLANQQNNEYYLSGNSEQIEQVFGPEFEQQLQSIIESSVGTILMNLGQQMFNNENQSLEQSMDDFSNMMDNYGEQLSAKMEQHSQQFEQQAEQMCQQLKQLEKMGQQVQQQIPQLQPFGNVISTQ